MENFHFGDNLRRIRAGKEKQEHLANKLEISQSKLSKIENKKELPSRDLILRLAQHLGVSPGALTPDWWDPEHKVEKHYRQVRILCPGGQVFYLVCVINLILEICSSIINDSLEPTIFRVVLCIIAAGGLGILFLSTLKTLNKGR